MQKNTFRLESLQTLALEKYKVKCFKLPKASTISFQYLFRPLLLNAYKRANLNILNEHIILAQC